MAAEVPKIDKDEVLQGLAPKKGRLRNPKTLYISDTIYDSFKSACGDVPMSQVVERLMSGFIASAGGKRGKK